MTGSKVKGQGYKFTQHNGVKVSSLQGNGRPIDFNQSINQSFILPQKLVTIKASKTKHMGTGQQFKAKH